MFTRCDGLPNPIGGSNGETHERFAILGAQQRRDALPQLRTPFAAAWRQTEAFGRFPTRRDAPATRLQVPRHQNRGIDLVPKLEMPGSMPGATESA
jgi:hypothetical protein